MKSKNVTENRDKYIGGSDIPVIMGISAFKEYFDLLLEKGGVKENDFKGNEYTVFGDLLEPTIREYVNSTNDDPFKEDTLIKDNVRCNVDGMNSDTILEIKTTSQIKENVEDYKVYLVQLLFYMMNYGYTKGKLAVYERPKDFDTRFKPNNLTIFDINIDDYKDLCDEINEAVNQFLIDLEKVKENPFITEEELVPTDLNVLATQVIKLENQLKEYDKLKKKYDNFKDQLHKIMTDKGIKGWEMRGGTKVTNVLDGEDTIKKVFDEKKFKEEHQEEYNQYLIDKEVKGRKGYVRFTFKEVENE